MKQLCLNKTQKNTKVALRCLGSIQGSASASNTKAAKTGRFALNLLFGMNSVKFDLGLDEEDMVFVMLNVNFV